MPMLKMTDINEQKYEEKRNPIFFKSSKFTLIDLLQCLNEKHLNAVLIDDKIYCDKKVIIHLEENNTLKIEGVICREYYQIREIIYSKYFKI